MLITCRSQRVNWPDRIINNYDLHQSGDNSSNTFAKTQLDINSFSIYYTRTKNFFPDDVEKNSQKLNSWYTIERLRARTIPWFFGHFWKCSEVVEFWHALSLSILSLLIAPRSVILANQLGAGQSRLAKSYIDLWGIIILWSFQIWLHWQTKDKRYYF